jgi:hypothetical protein
MGRPAQASGGHDIMRRAHRITVIVAAVCLPGAFAGTAITAASAATAAVGPRATTSCQYYINASNVHIRYEPDGTDKALTNKDDLFWSSPYTSSGVVGGQRWIWGTDLHTSRTGWIGRDYLTLQLCT